jgi:hypothetical protein
MQHWADRIDDWLDPKKGIPIKGGARALSLLSSGWLVDVVQFNPRQAHVSSTLVHDVPESGSISQRLCKVNCR